MLIAIYHLCHLNSSPTFFKVTVQSVLDIFTWCSFSVLSDGWIDLWRNITKGHIIYIAQVF